MPNFIQTVIYKLRKPDPTAGNKISDFAAIVGALADDVDAALGTSIFASGDLKASAASVPPTGWLLCDGSAVSRTGHASLYAAIGTAYGAGDGSSTFNIPDYRGRTIVGAGTGTATGATAHARGQAGGEETHTLIGAEAPAHSHTPFDGNAYIEVNGAGAQAGVAGVQSAVGSGYAIVNVEGTTASSGGGGAHNNMQPYAVANVFIKT